MNHSANTSGHKQTKLLSLSIGVLSVVFAVWSILWFWSALITVRPLKVITAWEQKNSSFKPALANKLIPRLKQSLSLNPLNAESYITLARLYEQMAHNSFELNDDDKTDSNLIQKIQKSAQNYLCFAEVNCELPSDIASL